MWVVVVNMLVVSMVRRVWRNGCVVVMVFGWFGVWLGWYFVCWLCWYFVRS